MHLKYKIETKTDNYYCNSWITHKDKIELLEAYEEISCIKYEFCKRILLPKYSIRRIIELSKPKIIN